MKALFTRGKALNWAGVKEDLITWGLEQPVSHVGLMFNNGQVIHSTWAGVEVIPYDKFVECREIMAVIDHELTDEEENEVFSAASEYEYKQYDWLFLFKLILQVIANKLGFGKVEYWKSWDLPQALICHEIYEIVPEDYRPKKDLSKAATPFELYLLLEGE